MGKKITQLSQMRGLISRRIKRYDTPCTDCGTMENRTRHHLKDLKGNKTGVIKILCRPCHDKAEKKYREEGSIIGEPLTITPCSKG